MSEIGTCERYRLLILCRTSALRNQHRGLGQRVWFAG